MDSLITLSQIFNSGFSINIKNGVIQQIQFKTGYLVSYKTLIKIKDNKIKILNNDFRGLIGGYKSKLDNTYYIEKNKYFNNKQKALKYAKIKNQYSIWDIENNEEVCINEIE